MRLSKKKFTLKIILSYLVLGGLAFVASVFLYSEFENFMNGEEAQRGERFLETGTLVNLVYETDGYSRLALLSENEEDFEVYREKSDSLFVKIEDIKKLTTTDFQARQLDSVKSLLEEKNQNIEQLRVLKITNSRDTSLDDILEEFKKLDTSMGKLTLETFVKNPERLTQKERRVWESYVQYLNSNVRDDPPETRAGLIDSMLTASRFIVAEAKKENTRTLQSLQQKENELILTDMEISEQLRQIISAFDVEITRQNSMEELAREASINRTQNILRYAGILGALVILFFTYVILNDFFKAEKFKKNLEEANEYSKALLKTREQLMATVSHDLKTPLNTILGYSELFENTDPSEKQRYYMSQIETSSQFINKLVDDLLDFSKLEAGKLPLKILPFSLENLITETGKAATDIHPQKPVALEISISEELKNRTFLSDPLRIKQVINNLVGNAFKFTEKGKIKISATILKSSPENSLIRIEIKDTGIGISKEKQQLIFNEFTQADADTVHKFGGSGLGLTISKKLAELLGGSLNVESSLGEGSTFIFTVKLKNSTLSVPKKTSPELQGFSNLTVLIFDDDPSMLALLKELFEQMGMVCHAHNSFNDFKNTESFAFDFVLTDIQMPEMDGFEVLKQLKSGAIKNYTDQPVIAMTGDVAFMRNEFIEKGFSEMLKKPFTKESLIKKINGLFPEAPVFSKETTAIDVSRKLKTEHYDLSLLQSFMISEKGMEEVLTVFSGQTEIDLNELQATVNKKNYGTVNATAHRMLTMFRQIQAQKAIPILEELENCNEENCDENQFKVLFENLKLQTDMLTKVLKNKY